MCGIVGFYSTKNDYTVDDLKNMTETLAHRGPDASGYFSDDICFLGHRRLSILDTSENANQPFFSNCKRYILVFNGEIYNFKELSTKYNIATNTTSDTEVLIELYAKLGESVINELNGMFTIAIYDKEEEVLTIFRDRVGIKPLFYYQKDDLFVFASELKALKLLIKKKLEINQKAIATYLYQGYIPEPRTIYQDVRKFPSGTMGTIKKNSVDIRSYWNSSNQITKEVNSDEAVAKKELKELLYSSVRYRMISDVPLGTFLSGGTDSSLVTAIAQDISSNPVKTFSIGFKDAKYNESQHARQVASYLKTDHHEFMLSETEAIEQVDDLLNIYDEPFADSSAIPTLLVSKMARKEVTVTLSGDGGDELFMGYGMYSWANRLSNPVIQAFRKPIASLLAMGDNRKKRASMVFNYNSNDHLKSHIFSQEQYLFSEKEVNAFLISDTDVDIVENFKGLNRALTSREEQAFFDLNNYLKDDLLVKVDRASMYHSLETRVPLLDHRIVEFAINLDESLKVKKGIEKYLLKEVLYEHIPKKIMQRPKWGFSIPLQNWLRTDLYYLVEEYLSQSVIEDCNVVDYHQVKILIQNFNAGKTYLYNRLWLLILLHKWLKEND